MREGWICPKCGRVNSPDTNHCSCVETKPCGAPVYPWYPVVCPFYPSDTGYYPWPQSPYDRILVTC